MLLNTTLDDILNLPVGAIGSRSSVNGPGTGEIFLDNVGCTGTETSLLDCSPSMTATACSHSSDAGVRCNPARMSISVIKHCTVICIVLSRLLYWV